MTAPRIFGVDYQFLSCGDVFTHGLVHAAETLGVTYEHADWNDPDLTVKLERFSPDLLFVVHGRRFCQRWDAALIRRAACCPTAIWITDEPYEVDDTTQWTSRFDHVFLNDPATLDRHPHASYLPVCFDPSVHLRKEQPRPYEVGFIGGGNPTRDRYLAALARAGQLTYVVGGLWADEAVNRLCWAQNVRPAVTASWYQQTRIIVNIFRDLHHFNYRHTPATSLNPRVYEALACGSLVVSEWRPEVDTLVPDLPTFESEEECIHQVRTFLTDRQRAQVIWQRCWADIQMHTYAARLQSVMKACGLRQAVLQ